MTSWSYSSYSSAVKCLRHYKLCYVDQLKPDVPDSGDLCFGSAMHSAINGILTEEDGEALFTIYWDSYKEKELEYGRFKWAELRDLGLKFIAKFIRLHANKYQVSQAEKRLYSTYKGIRLEGTPDFIGLYSGQKSLRDFKTSGYNYAREKGPIALQLYLYAYLAIQETGFTPETLGYDVFNKGVGSIQTMTWDFDKNKMHAMLDDLVEYCQSIETNAKFPRNPNGCLMGTAKCSYFGICWGNSGLF